MCYFVEINLPRQQLEERFHVPMPFDSRYMPGYFLNAFSKPYLPVITSQDPDRIQTFRWGLIPFWVKDEPTAGKISLQTCNARAETLWDKPSFREAARHKRCLVLAHGFFEWYSAPGKKIPFYIRRKDNQPFAFAGLYDTWTNPSTGEITNSFSIVTTKANALLEKIHNSKKRMPVILPASGEADWISQGSSRTDLTPMLEPSDPTQLDAWSISRKISAREVDPADESLLVPVDYPETQGLLST